MTHPVVCFPTIKKLSLQAIRTNYRMTDARFLAGPIHLSAIANSVK